MREGVGGARQAWPEDPALRSRDGVHRYILDLETVSMWLEYCNTAFQNVPKAA